MFAISFPGLDALKTIYLSILNGHISALSFPQAVQKNAEKLVDAALAMNQKVPLLNSSFNSEASRLLSKVPTKPKAQMLGFQALKC